LPLSRFLVVGVLVVVAAAAGTARAEDPLAPEAAPAKTLDLQVFLGHLRESLAAYQEAPAQTKMDHALYDAWSAFLKPRAGRMVSRLRVLEDKRRWETAPDGFRFTHLKPAEWDRVVREVAGLYTELGGALEQYTQFRVKYVAPFVGLGGQPQGPPTTDDVERSLRHLDVLEVELANRVKAGDVIYAEDVLAYWGLLARVEAETNLYQERLRKWEDALQRTEDMRARVDAGIKIKKDSLRLHMLSLRALVAGLQAAEEDRLRALVVALPDGSKPRAEADGLLLRLRDARRKGEAYRESPHSKYGTILRQEWQQARSKLLSLLGAPEPAAAEPEPAGGETPSEADAPPK
jgi:hypothetical protein